VETSTVEVGMEYREPEMTFVQFYLYRYSTNTHLSNTQDSAPSVRKNGIFWKFGILKVILKRK